MALLRIAQVAPLWTSVPPTEYGGAELVVSWLTEGLVRHGCEVTLFASGDSRTSALLHSICDRNLVGKMSAGEAFAYEGYANAALVEALRMADRFDVIHCHLGAAYIPIAALCPTPMLYTVHAGLDSADELWMLEHYPDVSIAALSHSHVAAVSATRRRNIDVIYHGCDFDEYQGSTAPGNYLLFLGRMSSYKNPLGAIRVAQAVGMPIILAGKPMSRAEEGYFDDQVRPLIDGHDVQYVGPVSSAEKVELMGGAAALVFPIRWDEHFGVVMVEAMACGCPVVASRRGSVGEVVDFGITGFYADSEDELAALVPRALSLDRRLIRAHAQNRFGVDRMVRDHLEVYRRLVSTR
ncbi:MAG TPA: glycosyltransferase family 4 protein [Deltaproteobacteria bacterium]|nr:glycosyltransferase family 4 protein [Deltaproteobacteria bacterium]